jgi:CBS-domain-containing membrane protein
MRPICDLLEQPLRCIPGSSSLPALLFASIKNGGGPVPTLDEDGRMIGLVEQHRILIELSELARQQVAEPRGPTEEGQESL